MIVYYIEEARGRGVTWGRKKIARQWVGTVYFYDNAKSRALRFGTPTNHRPKILFRATIFDDSMQPPKLIRCDYGFDELAQCGAALPPMFMDSCENIVRSCDDVIVLHGPDEKRDGARWFKSSTDGTEQQLTPPVHPDLTQEMKGFYP